MGNGLGPGDVVGKVGQLLDFDDCAGAREAGDVFGTAAEEFFIEVLKTGWRRRGGRCWW